MIEFINLKNKDSIKLIQDTLLFPLKVNRDESGVLVETLRKDWPDIYGKERDFSMQYFSVTQPTIARDENVWHYHPTVQEDRFLVAYGEIVVAIADNRKDSPTYGLLNLFHMQSDQDPYILLIPKRTLHGFLVVSKIPAVLLNFPTAIYNPKEEERISYEIADVKTETGEKFSWQIVRNQFPNLSSQ